MKAITVATTFETSITRTATPTLAERFASWATNTSKTVQVAQMTRALAQLNDEQLAKVGLTRSGISAHAHRIVYHGA